MSIIQALIGSIVSSGSGGGGGNNNIYPNPGGISYYTSLAGGLSSIGTAYNPGGAVDTIYSSVPGGWRRVTSEGFWSNIGSGLDDNPGIFNTIVDSVMDNYGGFGSTASAENFAMEWYGYFLAPPGTYHNVIIQSDDVAMFWIGNAAISPNYNNRHVGSNNNTVTNDNSLLLTEGKWYPIRMRFQEWSGAEYCQVYLATEGGTAYAMNTYATASPTRLAWSTATGNYASFNSEILHLGSATTNVYSGSFYWLDSSPALNHATRVGSPTWLPNDSGGVWYLGGTDYFDIPSLPKYNDPQATISMWFNIPTDTTVSQTLISKELTFKIRVDPTGDLGIYAGNGYSPWIVNAPLGSVYTYGEWTNITVTISSANVVIYKNGAEIANTGGTGTDLSGTGDFPFNIGGYSNGSDLMTGKVGEVKYYTGIRTAQEIADYYTATQHRYIPLGPYNTSNVGSTPGTVFFDTTTYPDISTVPVGALMKGTIFADPDVPVTIEVSEAWPVNPTLWVVYYTAPGGTENTALTDTFTFTWQ